MKSNLQTLDCRSIARSMKLVDMQQFKKIALGHVVAVDLFLQCFFFSSML